MKVIQFLTRKNIHFQHVSNKGSCVNENHRMSEIMLPVITTSSPTTPPMYENHVKFEDVATNNISSPEITI